MNKIFLVGHICRDCELRYTPSQKATLNNTLAVRRDYKNSNNEYESDFINVVFWGNTAEYVSNYCNKGSKLLVEGKLTTRSYQADNGETKYVTEVNVEKAENLTPRERINDVNEMLDTTNTAVPLDQFEEMRLEVEKDLESFDNDDLPF